MSSMFIANREGPTAGRSHAQYLNDLIVSPLHFISCMNLREIVVLRYILKHWCYFCYAFLHILLKVHYFWGKDILISFFL